MIALEDLKQPIGKAKNFTWSEALYLPKWDVTIFPTTEQMANIVVTAEKLQAIRDYFNSPIDITVWLRSLKYNILIGGSKNSVHPLGMAVDFKVRNYSSDEIRKELAPELERLKIRVENADTEHVHMDIRSPGPGGRFFTP